MTATVFFTERKQGSMIDEERREALIKELGQADTTTQHYLKQVHGNTVVRVVATTPNGIEADAMITDQQNQALLVFYADCLPVIFIAQEKEVIGIAHAGRKGIEQKVISSTVTSLAEAYEITPEELAVVIGPGIGACCYELGEEAEAFAQALGSHDFLVGDNADLLGAAVHELIENGVDPSHIDLSHYACTSCNHSQFFSFRRGDRTERSAAFVCLCEG